MKEAPRRGRPRSRPPSQRNPATSESKPTWRSKFADASHWDGELASINEDRLHIDQDVIDNLAREGIVLQWMAETALGQEQTHAMSVAQRNGWQRVEPGEIPGINATVIEGLILMARPRAIHLKATQREQQSATERVTTLQHRHGMGDLPNVSLSPEHPTARKYNHHRKTVERISIPSDD